jgi:hypothetical protein
MSYKKVYDDYEWITAIKKRFRQIHPSWEIPDHNGQVDSENGTLNDLAKELAGEFDAILRDVDY